HEVDPVAKRVEADHAAYPYDYLIVATGATMRPEEIPGLGTYAKTIFTPTAMLELQPAFHDLLTAAVEGKHQRVLFVVPPNNKCSGPLYEMIMMLDSWLRKHSAREHVDLIWTTYEHSFIQAFGPRLHTTVLGEFTQRKIEGHTDFVVERIEQGKAIYHNGEEVPFDLLVSFPPYAAATAFPGLPADERGFLQTDQDTRQVRGFPEIYAVGDASDFPVKQAFLAFLQGDVAAERIASLVQGRIPEVTFDPVSMCVMEEFNRATFAQVPLRVTGRPDLPVEVRPEAMGDYRVGTSRAWRAGKMMLGMYLPWRFRAGNPFHSGLPWRGMELGLKVMSTVLAS
ncbi:MAG: FAD-dependent oxidoreductase, partial [Chloroflexi bacterium]|nr:FAD-dependent oxidoreductase [Chloroflexota bacterium]